MHPASRHGASSDHDALRQQIYSCFLAPGHQDLPLRVCQVIASVRTLRRKMWWGKGEGVSKPALKIAGWSRPSITKQLAPSPTLGPQ